MRRRISFSISSLRAVVSEAGSGLEDALAAGVIRSIVVVSPVSEGRELDREGSLLSEREAGLVGSVVYEGILGECEVEFSTEDRE